MSNSLIERVRAAITDGTLTRAGLARAAGLHANTLRDCTEADWNPTAETLAKLERFLMVNDERPVLVPIEEIIDEARNGRMYILVDDEDRENEGDLIIPAQMATPAAINFMATHGRGLICLAITGQRADQLGLTMMSSHNGTRHETAFTVSIEAREGVTTGISAGDRARTISVAIDGSKGKDDIVTPGHVFPLRARPGGVLVRTGHTEAAVDISRLAGLNPSGVICEVMRDDGQMARLEDLVGFARLHDMKIGTIRDLIAYRRKHDRMVEKRAESRFTSRWGGDWTAVTYFNKATGEDTMALVKGHIDPAAPPQVAVLVHPDLVPGRQPLNVGGEDILRTDRHPHTENRLGKQVVGAGRAGTVDIGKADDKIINTFQQLHSCPACAESYLNFCISQAEVGHRSAQMPQCRQTFSSFTMTRPVVRGPET